MTGFQVILVAILGCLLLVTVVAAWRAWGSRRVLVAWAVLWIIGLVAAVWPDLTTLLAHALGIERGADLLVYCMSLAMLMGFFMLYIRLRRVRRDLTILTRRLAMIDVHENPPHDDETEACQAPRASS